MDTNNGCVIILKERAVRKNKGTSNMWESTENSHPDGRLNPCKRTENALIK